MQYLTFAALLVFSFLGNAQNTAVSMNETLRFTAAYNMSGIMTDIAELTMETRPVKTSKATLLRLKCTATTYSKWDTFFKIRDLYESYVHPTTLQPYLYKRDINEGGYYKFMQYTFLKKTNTVQSLKKKRRGDGSIWEEKKVITIGKHTQDIVSTLYGIRNLDLESAQIGQTYPLTVIFDNLEYHITLSYQGQEIRTTKLGTKNCHKLGITIKNSQVLKGAQNNLIWLTADANKIPVYAKFKIAVGNGELKLNAASGLKN
ncbi:DUF3108 domain-containing protein [Bizionia sediminis]|uniref:DUF3108 domain-containing protein n=1 Tax=Bizionia sediminis TaxID=1737064 RepID=A0ABW5KNV8_9FLAO